MVLDAIARYYEHMNANIHRGVHTLSVRATEAHDAARQTVRRFLNARETREIIFVRGATEAINLVAQTYGRVHVGAGDEVLITAMEHHSNIVPWQILCEEKGAHLQGCAHQRSRRAAARRICQAASGRARKSSPSRMFQTLWARSIPLREIIAMAHRGGVPVLVDGAQAVPHFAVDVQALDCDFYVFSGHKVYGPTGIGVLYGKRALLEAMPPYQGGGDMISSVTFDKTTYNELPYQVRSGHARHRRRHRSGRGARVHRAIWAWTRSPRTNSELLDYATEAVGAIPGMRLIGTARERAGVLSFVLDGVHPHDMGTILDREGIAIRTGHHCAQPVMDRFGIPATARASFAVYNTKQEVDALVAGIRAAREVFA